MYENFLYMMWYINDEIECGFEFIFKEFEFKDVDFVKFGEV